MPFTLRTHRRALPCLLLGLAIGCASATAPTGGALPYAACTAADPYWPTTDWRSTCPSAVGLDTTALRGALNAVRDSMPSARSLVIARHGYIALESYWHGAAQGTAFETRSVTKAMTATLVGAAIEQGRIPGVDQTLVPYFPEYLEGVSDTRKRAITIENLLDLNAGFDLTGPPSDDRSYATRVLSRPLIADPGTTWSYDEPLYHLLSIIVGEATGESGLALAAERIFGPLGMPGVLTRWPMDAGGNPFGASGLRLTAREMLTLGHLYLHEGVWDGTRVLPDGWVRDHVAPRPDGAIDTQTFWVRGWRQTVYAGHLTYYALGYGGQFIFVIPDLEMTVVATADPRAPENVFPQFGRLVRDRIIPAIQG